MTYESNVAMPYRICIERNLYYDAERIRAL